MIARFACVRFHGWLWLSATFRDHTTAAKCCVAKPSPSPVASAIRWCWPARSEVANAPYGDRTTSTSDWPS